MRSDVAIVGAGPAGAWAAYRLASAGVRVTLFDPSHPREKPCGGGITGRAIAIVQQALRGCTCEATAVSSARFETDSHQHAATVSMPAAGFSKETSLAVMSRADFDLALLEAAVQRGATLVQERVIDVSIDGRVRVSTSTGEHVADLLAGADGANSLVRRKVGRPFSRSQLSIATGFFAHGVTSSEVIIRWTSDPAGYLWSFPRPGHLAIGICAQADVVRTAAPLRERISHWIETSGIAKGARLAKYSWPIPSLTAADFERERPAGPRWVLLGDAAGLVDPITREGIFFALRSGDLAADTLLENRASPVALYRERLNDEIYPELQRAAAVKDAFFRPRFTKLLVDALAGSQRIREVMVDLIAGRQSYRGLQWRLLASREIGLAWRLLSKKP